MKKLLLALSSALLFSQAQAADMTRPVYKAAPVAVSGNVYVWVDGTYNRVRLPSSSLGLHAVGPLAGGLVDNGPIQTFDNKLDGAGVRGAFGYVMPGSTLRFELGGSYVSADGSSQQTYSTPQAFIGPSASRRRKCSASFSLVLLGEYARRLDRALRITTHGKSTARQHGMSPWDRRRSRRPSPCSAATAATARGFHRHLHKHLAHWFKTP